MNRSPLKFLAVLLGTVMCTVPFMGLDSLPRPVRAEIAQERSALSAATRQVASAKTEVADDLSSEAALFKTVDAARQWPSQLDDAQAKLAAAGRDADELAKLEKLNRRADRARAESLIAEEQRLRSAATAEASDAQSSAAHWVELKRQLPDELHQMESDYRAIQAFDLAPAAATVQKAETDWPGKKADLDARLAALHSEAAKDGDLWQSTAADRQAAAAQDYAHLNFGNLMAAAGALHTAAAGLPTQSAELTALSGQLYDTWDKVLVDMEKRDHAWDQKIRTVRTHMADATAKTGETTSDEKWVDVSQGAYQATQNDLGMAIEHKPAGEYDFEAERTAQPAGFAYVAPPTVGSNQYGYWDHHDGRDFWVFYGQYALLRDLLFNHDYHPLYRGDWDEYRTYQSRGRTYYGTDEATNAPKYGTQGATTQQRYSGSTFAKSGGFRDSEYARRSGSYRDSHFASPQAHDPNADHEAHRFGSHGSPVEPHMTPRPSPSFHMPSGGGRRFGGRHR